MIAVAGQLGGVDACAALCRAPPAAQPPLNRPRPPLPQVCTDAQVLRASFPTFSLPTAGAPQLSLLVHVSALDCAARPRGAPAVLFGLGGGAGGGAATPPAVPVDVSVDCGAEQLVLSSPGLDSVAYSLPGLSTTTAAGPLALLLSADQRSFALCANGQHLVASTGGGALLERLASAGSGDASAGGSFLGRAVVFGARSDAARSARAEIAGAFVLDAAIPCNSTEPGAQLDGLLAQLAAAAAASSAPPPTVTVAQHPTAAVVNEPVRLTVSASPGGAAGGDAHRLRVTLFGLVPEGCTAAECGDRLVDAPLALPGQPAALELSAVYSRAGRYAVRVEVRRGKEGCRRMRGGWLAEVCARSPPRLSPSHPLPCCAALPSRAGDGPEGRCALPGSPAAGPQAWRSSSGRRSRRRALLPHVPRLRGPAAGAAHQRRRVWKCSGGAAGGGAGLVR